VQSVIDVRAGRLCIFLTVAHASDVSRSVEWTEFVIDDGPAERWPTRQTDPVADNRS